MTFTPSNRDRVNFTWPHRDGSGWTHGFAVIRICAGRCGRSADLTGDRWCGAASGCGRIKGERLLWGVLRQQGLIVPRQAQIPGPGVKMAASGPPYSPGTLSSLDHSDVAFVWCCPSEILRVWWLDECHEHRRRFILS